MMGMNQGTKKKEEEVIGKNARDESKGQKEKEKEKEKEKQKGNKKINSFIDGKD